MPLSRNRLVKETEHFLALHWPPNESKPTWSDKPWTGIDSVPHYNLQGCYALLRGDRITYIGSAFGRGNTLRRGFGISSRLAGYYVRRDRTVIREDKVPVYTFRHGYTAAYTIGFSCYSYLAIALEHYLIGRFAADLPDNRIKIFEDASSTPK